MGERCFLEGAVCPDDTYVTRELLGEEDAAVRSKLDLLRMVRRHDNLGSEAEREFFVAVPAA
jgi:hypothetical protein